MKDELIDEIQKASYIGRGDSFVCERERINAYSDIAIVAKRRSQMIEHIPERLAKILTPILEDGQLKKIDGCITEPKRPVPEVPGGREEI